MSKKKPKNITTDVNHHTALSQGLLAGVCFLVFYPLFVRGLYFEQETAVHFMLTALLTAGIIVLKVKRRDYALLSTPLDATILVFVISYLLSLVNAIHIGEAVWGFLKVLNYFLIYVLVSQVIADLKAVRVILKILVAAGVGVAVIGLMAATGFSDYPGAFVNQHIMSTLQYHNTMAAFLGAMSFIGFALLLTTDHLFRKLIYSGAIFLMAVVSISSISKGALLIIMIAAFLFLLSISGRPRWVYLYDLLYLYAVAFLTSSLFMQQITGTQPARGLVIIVIGLSLAILGQLLGTKLLVFCQTKYFRKAAIAVMIIFLLGIGFLVAAPAGQNLLPQELNQEIAEIADFSDPSYLYRADFIRWGIDIARDYPLTGTGAGGWEALLPQYQDYKYAAADSHNHMIQVLVEAGIIGLTAFIAIWVLIMTAVLKFHRRIRKSDKPKKEAMILLGGTLSAAAAIGLHALIDFDLSIPAIFIVLVTLFAVINQISKPADTHHQKNWIQLLVLGMMAIVLFLAGCSLTIGNAYAEKAAQHLKEIEKNQTSYASYRETATAYLEKSRVFDPLDAENQINLSKCYASLYLDLAKQKSPMAAEAYKKTLSAIDKAEKLMPNDVETITGALNSAVTIGNLDHSLKLARKIVEIEPNRSSSYEVLGEVLYGAARFYLQSGDLETADKYITELHDLPSIIKEQQKSMNQERLAHRMGNHLRVSQELAVIIEKTDELEFLKDISSSGQGGY